MKKKTIKKLKKTLKKIPGKILGIIKNILKLILYIFSKTFLAAFVFFLFITFAWWSSQTPSLYRDWTYTEAILSEITFSWSVINIKNVRNFKHISETKSIPGYYDETYDLDKIESLYYIIEPFSDYDWPAHTMLSFGFSDWKYVTISAELRKEKWESFSPFWGIMNQFEIVYIIWDENDLVKLRANIRKDTVRMYPMKATKEQMQDLFSSALHRADKLTKEPEFYNTIYNTCTTSILRHVNTLRSNKISSFDMKILLPSNSDEIAYQLWLIDTKLSLKEAREYYKVNRLSEIFADNKNYEEKIRVKIK